MGELLAHLKLTHGLDIYLDIYKKTGIIIYSALPSALAKVGRYFIMLTVNPKVKYNGNTVGSCKLKE